MPGNEGAFFMLTQRDRFIEYTWIDGCICLDCAAYVAAQLALYLPP